MTQVDGYVKESCCHGDSRLMWCVGCQHHHHHHHHQPCSWINVLAYAAADKTLIRTHWGGLAQSPVIIAQTHRDSQMSDTQTPYKHKEVTHTQK